MDHKKLKKAETLEEALSLFSKDALSANDVLDSFYVDTNKVRYAEATAEQIQIIVTILLLLIERILLKVHCRRSFCKLSLRSYNRFINTYI